ncbi:MAG: flagellar hook basal-body protein [Acidobacteriota bacterium]|nr:flagellar hook basal-body protein [Acidobacteriota bacterium]MDQ7088970.1 flagellar hook basal-body protein [Acidobacteriota bacterium]
MFPQLYTGASGMVAAEKNLEVVTHNLANAKTPAYTPERALFAAYLDQRLGDASAGGPLPAARSVALGGNWRIERPGPMRSTGNPLDLALEGPGWFRVMTPGGERLTRAGSLTRTADGALATMHGMRVLDDQGRPITLPEGELQIGADGTLTVNDEVVARLGIASAPMSTLERDGDTLWRPLGPVRPLEPESVRVVQGFIEDSGVQPATELISMVAAQRMFEMQQRVVQATANTVARKALELGGVK